MHHVVSAIPQAPALTLNEKVIRTFYERMDHATDWAIAHVYQVLVILIVAAIADRLGGLVIDKLFGAIRVGLGGGTNSADRAAQRAHTVSVIARSTFRAVVFFATTLTILAEVGINITPILASAGILGLAVGFGAQSLIKDVINGFFVLLEDQYGVGDTVTIGTHSGLVERMNLRVTQLRSADGHLISIPNGKVEVVANQSKEWARAVVDVKVALTEDVDRVLAILREEGRKLFKDLPGKVLAEPEVPGVEGLDETSLGFRVMVKTAPGAQWAVARDYRYRIKHAFDREQVTLPVPLHAYVVHEDAPSVPRRPARRPVEGAEGQRPS